MDLALLGAAHARRDADPSATASRRGRARRDGARRLVGTSAAREPVDGAARRRTSARRWRSTARRDSSTRSGATRRTCRASCSTSSRCARPASARLTGSRARPAAACVEWDVGDRRDQPGQLIAWRTLPNSQKCSTKASCTSSRRRRARHDRQSRDAITDRPAARSAQQIARLFGTAPAEKIQRGPAPPEATARDRRDRDHAAASRPDGAASSVGPRSGGCMR